MIFNPNPSKQAQEVIFSRKLQKPTYNPLIFNNNTVTQSVTQKYLRMFLDAKLGFRKHLKNILSTSTSYNENCKRTSTGKLHNELGLETLEQRRWYRKLRCFYKVYKSRSLKHLCNIIPVTASTYNTRNASKT